MNLLKYRIPCYRPEDGSGAGASDAAMSSSAPLTPAASESPPATSSPAPSAPTGSPQAATESAPAGAGEAFDFSSIFEGSADESPPEVRPAAAKPAAQPQEPAVQPTTPAQPAAPTAAPPAPPAAASLTPSPATPQTPAPAAQEFDRYDPAMLARHLAGNEEQALQYVADNVFKLSPQEIEALETNVHEAIPKLLAKVFVKSQQNVLSQLASMVPVMIQRQSVAMQRNSENADKFYARWPMISKAQHGDLVMQYGAVYRQMHPNATLEQMIEDLGPMVMLKARIAPQPVAPVAVPGVPANPAAQRAAANGRSPPPSPFVPAGGAGPAATATAPELSPWEAMFRHED